MHSMIEGRGGYSHLKVDLSDALNQPPPEGAPTHDEIWERTLKIFRNVVPVAESAGVNVAMHGNDPPVPSLHGVPQVLYNFAAFDRLFSEVPSPNNGMTFCVGTRYESGEDVFEGIRHFGEQGKIFHVHFRNVRGKIPEKKGYEEVIPDAGDMDMYRVAKALHDVGYDAVIDYDHIMRLTTDGPEGREYIAYCVGHMRGLLQALESNS
jgi:mannonate dehydratase